MKKTALHILENLPFFSRATLRGIEAISLKALYENLQRWVKNGDLIRLKNGLYVTRRYVDRASHNQGYVELLANKLVSPSYLSTEYVLQKHNLLTEISFPITSVTLKTPRRIANPIGTFVYRHLHSRLYHGFEKRVYGRHPVYEASVEKALFDFLYLRLAQLDDNDASSIDALRITWSELKEDSFAALCRIIVQSGIGKINRMIPLLEEVYRGNTAG